MRRWILLSWFSPGFGLGALSCLGSPGHCGGLEIGDELIFVAHDSFEYELTRCTFDDLGFYPGQEFRFQAAQFPDGPFRGRPCHSAEGPVLTSSEWEYRYMVDSGSAGDLFHVIVDGSRRSCRGDLRLAVHSENSNVSERISDAKIFSTYEPTVHGLAECPRTCSGAIPGTVRKVPQE